MIKRETKYIIRRILIGVGIALILTFIRTCEVKAETTTNGLSYTQLRYYNGTNLITTLNPDSNSNNVWYYGGSGQLSNNWQIRSTSSYTIENNQVVFFNVRLRYTPNTAVNYPSINNITFGSQPCFYSVTNNTEINSSINDTYLSVMCLMNSSVNVTSGTTIISFSSDPVIYNTLAVSNITYVNNLGLYNLLSNGLSNIQTGISNTNTYLNWIDGLMETVVTNQNSILTKINEIKTTLGNIDTKLTWINGLIETLTSQNTTINNSINNNTQAINDTNNTLKDSNVDSPNNSITQMEQNLPTNSVISDLLTLPVRMFQNIVNAIDGTCSPFSLGALFGTNLVLPCINIQNYLGSALWGAIDVIFCGIFVLSMRKKFVEIFENITSLKNGGNELE